MQCALNLQEPVLCLEHACGDMKIVTAPSILIHAYNVTPKILAQGSVHVS